MSLKLTLVFLAFSAAAPAAELPFCAWNLRAEATRGEDNWGVSTVHGPKAQSIYNAMSVPGEAVGYRSGNLLNEWRKFSPGKSCYRYVEALRDDSGHLMNTPGCVAYSCVLVAR